MIEPKPGYFAELQKRLDDAYAAEEPERLRKGWEAASEEMRRLRAIVTDVANWSGHGNDPTGHCWEHWRDAVREALATIPATIADSDPSRRRWNKTVPMDDMNCPETSVG